MSKMRQLCLYLLISLCSLHAWANESVRIGVLADRPQPQIHDEFQPLAIALKQAMPDVSFHIDALSYQELEEAVAARQVDFVLTNPSHYVLMARTSGLSAPLATLIQNYAGKPTSAFGGVIITRASRQDIKSIADLRGKSLATTNFKSLGGYQTQAYEIKAQGIDVRHDMRLNTVSRYYDNVVESVLAGQADVGFVRSGLLESMASEGKLDLNDFKIINQQNLPDFPYRVSTRLYPEWPVAALPHTDVNLTRKVASVLLNMNAESSMLGAMNAYGFNIAADYAPVVEVLHELRLPPFEQAPNFTLQDIWKRYQGWMIALALTAAIVVALAISLIITNRRLLFSRIEAEGNAILLKNEHQQLVAVLQAVPDLLFELSESGYYINVWARDESLLSTNRDNLLGRSVHEILPADEANIVVDAMQQASKTGSSFGHQICLKINHQKKWFELSIALKPLNHADKSFIVLSRDITDRKKTEEDLRLASLVYENTNEAMMVTNTENVIIAVNPAFTALTGYSEEEALGKDPSILSSNRQSDDFYQSMWNSIHQTGHWRGEVWNKRKNGEEYAELLTINNIYDNDGEVHMRVALFSDLTYIKESEAIIWQQANYDALTNLPNRRLLLDRLDLELKKAQRDKNILALLFLDLDHFKEVNDTMGHHIGDALLQEAANRIKTCVRDSDTVARLGGDEFTLILSELTEFSDIERIAQNIINTISTPFQFESRKFFISASIGITVFPDDGKNVEDLLKNADQAMYAAKQAGRNRYRYFTTSMQQASQERVQLAHDLREAISGNQFELYYQPIINLANGKINKAEALLRWHHPERGLIGPTKFIQIAEDIGTIHDIGDWVFQQAAIQAKKWRESFDRSFQISVNASPVQFHERKRLDNRWIHHLQKNNFAQDSIVVEITEGLLLHSHHGIQDKLLHFRDAGIQVAIDDFGTGYSSLAYLNKFDIDYLKIDQSFVKNIAPYTSDLALTEAIIVMAHKLGLQVIAEGVETEQQFKLLRDIGCDYAQGFLFTKPLQAQQLEEYLANAFETKPA